MSDSLERMKMHLLALLLAVSCSLVRADSVVNSVHNLTATGQGSIKTSAESDVCIFCHTAHHTTGETPLWSHRLSGVTNYIVYSSTNLNALGLTIPQPNGSSRLCLSCHDGTVALGSVNSRTTTISMQQNGTSVTTMPQGPSNLGTDLSGDHPISFVYDSALAAKDPQIKDPAILTGKVRLDGNSRLQCTACHDPHNDQYGKFLVMDNTGSALCLTCHKVADWSGSAHAMSGQAATGPVPMTTSQRVATTVSARQPKLGAQSVAANGCANCHASHGAGGKQDLMIAAAPEQNCLPCHNGTMPGSKNVAADLRKASAHPITQNGALHNPKENLVNPSTRHVTCADCHNPHATTTTRGNRNTTGGALNQVAGLSAAGGTVARVTREYELCFRCHADSAARGVARVRRQFVETNTRLQFAATAGSFHPIEAPGRNPNVPSLVAPWNTSSLMTCMDCHNSDQNPSAGGNGANGPHGSIYVPLLERQLNLTDYTPENPASYSLCYKCHSRENILNDRSFRAVNSLGQQRGHRFHIVEAKAACTTCHDPHGVATAANLINFNRDYVSPASSGRLEYVSSGGGSGTCSLSCHGKDHQETSYPSSLGIRATASAVRQRTR
jgi:predicted CXXCH cytochrome family protein